MTCIPPVAYVILALLFIVAGGVALWGVSGRSAWREHAKLSDVLIKQQVAAYNEKSAELSLAQAGYRAELARLRHELETRDETIKRLMRLASEARIDPDADPGDEIADPPTVGSADAEVAQRERARRERELEQDMVPVATADDEAAPPIRLRDRNIDLDGAEDDDDRG